MPDCDVAVIGAGPYGLAAAAHLRQIKGLDLLVFGEPMGFWRTSMPSGMLLRSAWSASSIADPKAALTIDAYKQVSGNHLAAPVSLSRFVDYGLWFQRAAVPGICSTPVASVDQHGTGFRLILRDGQELSASRVIVAAGISSFAFRPPQFESLPASLVSHTSEQRDLCQFAGKRVAVIGSGQSALESAALLHEVGATVEVLIRRRQVHWLGWRQQLQKFGPIARFLFSADDVGPAGISRLVSLPSLLQRLPRRFQDELRRLCLRPAGARWLLERLRNVKLTTGKSVLRAASVGDSLCLKLSDGSNRFVDHALLGTGYRVDVTRYGFLSRALIRKLKSLQGFPKLAPNFESSVPGLHFLGAPAAWTFGPLMYFVSGTRFAAPTLLRSFQDSRNGNH